MSTLIAAVAEAQVADRLRAAEGRRHRKVVAAPEGAGRISRLRRRYFAKSIRVGPARLRGREPELSGVAKGARRT